MARPNIVTATSIVGKTEQISVDTTSNFSCAVNPASSSKVLKVNTLLVTNRHSATADITVQIKQNALYYPIVHTVSVPADSTLVVISKDTSIYIEEDTEISLYASLADCFNVTVSYEEIS